MSAPIAETPRDKITDKFVLLVIVGGLIALLIAVVVGTFLTARPNFTFPNWAENVLVAVVTGTLLKLGDGLSALVALSTGRQVERLGNQLAGTVPTDVVPMPVTVENKPSEPVPTTEAPPLDDVPPPPEGQEELP